MHTRSDHPYCACAVRPNWLPRVLTCCQRERARQDYFYYPFDVQALHIHFRVDGGHIYTCENQSALAPMLPFASETDAEQKLLPLTKEWTLANGLVDSIRLSHPTQNGVPQYHKCEIYG